MILFDTNILVYSQNKDDPRYKLCQKWIKKSEARKVSGVVSSQNLAEFTAVILRLTKSIDKPTQKDILKSLKSLQSGIFRIIYPNQNTLSIFHELFAKHKTTPRRVFDMFLVATMLSHDINKILTYNQKDFSLFTQIKTISP